MTIQFLRGVPKKTINLTSHFPPYYRLFSCEFKHFSKPQVPSTFLSLKNDIFKTVCTMEKVVLFDNHKKSEVQGCPKRKKPHRDFDAHFRMFLRILRLV